MTAQIASQPTRGPRAAVLQLVDPLQRAQRLLEAFLAARTPNTRSSYATGLDRFRLFLGVENIPEAIAYLVSLRSGDAHELVLGYQEALRRESLAAGTVNHRISVLRSLATVGRRLGLVEWGLQVRTPKAEPYRDTRGPGQRGVTLLLKAAGSGPEARAARDTAVLRLMYDLALRRSEVRNIDLGDLDLRAKTVNVLGKGRRSKIPLSMPPPTVAALRAYLAVRPCVECPALFVNRSGKRMTTMGLYRIVRALGESIGLRVRPHGLRHAAITAALDVTRGDVRAVQRFSRHRDISTLVIYDDNRTDLAAAVARRVARQVTGSRQGKRYAR